MNDHYASPSAAVLRAIVGTVIGTVVIAGIFAASASIVSSERTETTIVDPGQIGQVRIEADIANVVLKPAKGDELEFNATIVDGLSDTYYQLGRRGKDTYILDANCRRLITPRCGVTVTVGVPRGYPVFVATTSGDITIGDLTGVATVETTSGDVKAARSKLTELSAASGEGEVNVEFAGAPTGFKAYTDSGDIRATLPHSSLTYAVNARTTVGDLRVEMPNTTKNPKGFITIRSKSGDVDVRWSPTG
jgi:hypothetical protein